jgi:phenylacetate-CoA ligase
LRAQKKWQEKKFTQLINRAYTNVPYWRELLKKAELLPKQIHLSNLDVLPITSKKTFLGKTPDEFTDNSRPLHSYWYLTSGSSGIPLTFLLSEQSLQARYSDFSSLRFLWWRGISPSEFATINLARIRIRAKPSRHRLFVSVEDYCTNPRKEIAAMAAFKPVVVSTYPSLLLDMAQLVEKDPSVNLGGAQFALSIGETLTPSVRKFISEKLKLEVYDRYGLEEIGVVGIECAEHNGFHINSESVFIEIVDDSGKRVKEGEEGRILATSLHNYEMPFIRYDSGDRGKMTSEPCACGLRSPRLWATGRFSIFLAFPHRRIHHLEFDGAMDGFMNEIFQYQIAKKSDTNIVARIVPGPGFQQGTIEKVKNSLTSLVGSSISVEVELVEKVPISARGKCQIVVDES